MKRHGHLYGQVWSMDNIRLAHENARRGKRHYREVKMVDAAADNMLGELQRMLKDKTFRNSAYRTFIRKDQGKERLIWRLPYYPDRIVHHCIMQVVEPIWMKSYIADTYASLKGRGIHKGVRRIKEALKDRDATQYCFKGDVSQFYPSVDHDILKSILCRKMKDPDLLWLLDTIIDSAPGIPIGNYLSQHMGNLYLSGLDHYVKESLKCRYYFRYCDDLVVLGSCKSRLREVKAAVETYLQDRLNLRLKGNWQVFPVDARGVDFLGYRFFHDYTLVRKSIATRFKRKARVLRRGWHSMRPVSVLSGLMSYYGWLKHANSLNLIKKHIDADLWRAVDRAAAAGGMANPLMKIAGVPRYA